MVHILNITLFFSTLSSVWQSFPNLLRAAACRQALCKDSNYRALLGLIRLPSLDVLAREWRAGGERLERRGGSSLDITPRTLGSKDAMFLQAKLDLTNKLLCGWYLLAGCKNK